MLFQLRKSQMPCGFTLKYKIIGFKLFSWYKIVNSELFGVWDGVFLSTLKEVCIKVL